MAIIEEKKIPLYGFIWQNMCFIDLIKKFGVDIFIYVRNFQKNLRVDLYLKIAIWINWNQRN